MSATSGKKESGQSAPGKDAGGTPFRFLSSVKLALILLCLIAAASVIGTVVKQGGSPHEYEALYSPGTYRLLRFLGFDDVFRSWWFTVLAALFALNLILCSAERLGRLLRTGRDRAIPDEKRLSSFSLSFRTPASAREVAALFREAGYRQTYEADGGFILQKGRIGRYGVFIVHGSILLILLGGFIGFTAGFRGALTLHKGETGDRVLVRGTGGKEIQLPFAVKCKDFRVTFYPGGAPKDYVSTLEVLEGGKAVMEREIRVNDPLSYRGIRIYQATYGTHRLIHFTVGGETMTVGERETFQRGDLVLMVVRVEENIHNFGPGVMVAYLAENEPKTLWLLRDVEKMRQRDLKGVPVRFEKMEEDLYTGLEVAHDPGVWIVWAGFAGILFGLCITFTVRHRTVYVRDVGGGALAAGMSQKNREVFREELEGIRRRIDGVES